MVYQNPHDWNSFIDYYDTVRGWIRERLAQEMVRPFLPEIGVRIVDIGGGDGRDSVWLAGLGYDVTLLDPSKAMLQRARERAEAYHVHLNIIEDDHTVLEQEEMRDFDMAISHGVLMYCDDPMVHIKYTVASLKPGGYLSLLTNNYGGAKTKLQAKGADGQKALDKLKETHTSTNNLGIEVWAHTRGQIEEMLSVAGLKVLQVRGVRSEHDYDDRSWMEVTEKELNRILERERELGKDESYMDEKAQMLHYIAGKPQNTF